MYTGPRHWTQDAALIREFQREWNKREIEKARKIKGMTPAAFAAYALGIKPIPKLH
jgi:hypothetical protein